MLSQVTREVTVEALPTDIPDGITVDVSGLGVAETLTLAQHPAPEGVEFMDDLEETVVATSPPRPRSRSRRSRRRPSWSARRASRSRAKRARRRQRAPRAARSPPRAAAKSRKDRSAALSRPPDGRSGRLSPDRAGQPRLALRRHPSQHRLRDRRRARAPLGPAAGAQDVQRPGHRGARLAGRPAGRAAAAADLHERLRPLGRARRAAATGSTSTRWSRCTTRSTCRSARCRPGWAAGSPVTTGSRASSRTSAAATSCGVRVGVGRPDSTDPEVVSAYVLGRFREPRCDVQALIGARPRTPPSASLRERFEADELTSSADRVTTPAVPAAPVARYRALLRIPHMRSLLGGRLRGPPGRRHDRALARAPDQPRDRLVCDRRAGGRGPGDRGRDRRPDPRAADGPDRPDADPRHLRAGLPVRGRRRWSRPPSGRRTLPCWSRAPVVFGVSYPPHLRGAADAALQQLGGRVGLTDTAFALEAIMQELLFIVGPLTVAAVVALASPQAALAVIGALTAVGHARVRRPVAVAAVALRGSCGGRGRDGPVVARDADAARRERHVRRRVRNARGRAAGVLRRARLAGHRRRAARRPRRREHGRRHRLRRRAPGERRPISCYILFGALFAVAMVPIALADSIALLFVLMPLAGLVVAPGRRDQLRR